MAITASIKKRYYKDIDLNFSAHPLTGDISKVYDQQALKQSIKNLILTEYYSRPFHPEIGTYIGGALFENAPDLLEKLVRESCRNVVEHYDGRIRLLDVYIQRPDSGESVYVTLKFEDIQLNLDVTVDFFLSRVR